MLSVRAPNAGFVVLGLITVMFSSVFPSGRARANDGDVGERARMKPRDYWSSEPLRPFVGAVIDAGSSLRARLLAGYGRPHWTRGGVELEGSVISSVALYGTVRIRRRFATGERTKVFR